MTYRQEVALQKAVEIMNDARTILDDVMYRTDSLEGKEYNKVRSAYDKLCEAIDKL